MSSKETPKSSDSRPGRGGLFRRFILPQIVIIAVAGGIALVAAGSAQRDQEKDRLMEVVASNVRITDELNFPRSAQLADKASAFIDVLALLRTNLQVSLKTLARETGSVSVLVDAHRGT